MSLANTAHFETHIYKENYRMAMDFMDSWMKYWTKILNKIISNLGISLTTNNPINKTYIQDIFSTIKKKLWASDTERNAILHKTIRVAI